MNRRSLFGLPDEGDPESAAPFAVGRRDFLSILTYLLMALFGRLKIPAQLAPAAEAVQRAVFKGGAFKLSMMIKGFEVPKEVYEALMGDSDIRKTIAEATGVRFALPPRDETT